VTSLASGWTDTEASIRLRRGAGGAVRVDGTLCTAPLWFRWDGVTLWLVGSGASPAGEDHIRVHVDVGPDVTVRLRSVAATVVYAARGAGTRWHTELTVADGAHVDWRPEPVIVTARARHDAMTVVHAAAGASVTLDEVLVLGRAGEDPGTLRATLDVRVDGTPTLLTSFDTSIPSWSGPGGVDGASVVASRLRLVTGGETPEPTHPLEHPAALLHPAPGCRLAVATAPDVSGVRRSVDQILPV
jgi:urease accessory protein